MVRCIQNVYNIFVYCIGIFNHEKPIEKSPLVSVSTSYYANKLQNNETSTSN